MTAPPILCLYISIPLLIFSLFFTIFFPWATRQFQKSWYPVSSNNVRLPQNSFSMLGEELPDSADVPRVIKIRDPSLPRQRAPRPGRHEQRRNSKPRSRSRIRSLSARGRRRGGGGGGDGVEDKV
jgi:hypothetical protein